ncbi:hypothetical protein [Streptomyces sp. NPDC087317]|uniref:hypothetical protein n=1 Tax=Streptomyces sp. NPDC087317 TaxID=3365784 RepID=UPI0038218ACB
MKRWVCGAVTGLVFVASCSGKGDSSGPKPKATAEAKVYSPAEMQKKWTPVLQRRNEDMGPMTAALCMPPDLFTKDCDEVGKALAGDADKLVREVGGRPGFGDLLRYAREVQAARDTYISSECLTRPPGDAYTECVTAGRKLSLGAQSLLAGVNAAVSDSQ